MQGAAEGLTSRSGWVDVGRVSCPVAPWTRYSMEFDRYLSTNEAQSITSNFPAILHSPWGLDESTTGEKMAGWATSTGFIGACYEARSWGRVNSREPAN